MKTRWWIGGVLGIALVSAGLGAAWRRLSVPATASAAEASRMPSAVPPIQHRSPSSETATPVANVLMPGEACGEAEMGRERWAALAVKDPASAARVIETLPSGDLRKQLLPTLVGAWADADFAEAICWIARYCDAVERKAALEAACCRFAQTSPADAVRTWQALEYTEDDHVLANLVQSWAEKDLAGAISWVRTQPSSKARDQAVARIGYIAAQSRPAEAAILISHELPPGPAQTEAVMSILHQWARSDRIGASAWVEAFPPGPLAERARNELAGIAQYQGDCPP